MAVWASRIPVILAWLGLLLSLLHLYWSLSSAGTVALSNNWITSDSLYPVNVTTDIVHDGYPLSGWRFSIAPCWFPDIFATGLFWVLTRNAIAATLLGGFIQLALIAGAFHLMRKAIGLGSASLQTVLLLAVAVWITLDVAAHPEVGYPGLHKFFIPQSHVGSLVNSLYALAFGLLLLYAAQAKTKISRWWAASYAGVCLLAGMSNLMFLPQMLLPLTAAIALALFFGVLSGWKCWLPVFIGWPFAFSGALLNRILFHTTDVSAQSRISREAALLALDVYMRGAVGHLFDWMHILAILWMAVCLAAVAFILRKLVRRRADEVGLPFRLLWVFCCCWIFADLFSAGAVIAGGSNGLTEYKDYIWTTHYLQAIFFIPLFGLPLVAVWLIPKRVPAMVTRGMAVAGSVLVVAVPAARLAASPIPNSAISNYRPPLVEYLDDLASRDGLQYGLGGYWQSRITTLLSHKGLRVYAIDSSMKPFLWVSNTEWYTEDLADHHKPPPFHFVVLDDPAFKLSRDNAVQVFGEPSEEAHFENVRILVYRAALPWDPAMTGNDAPLTEFNEEITSPVTSLAAKPGETLTVRVLVKNPTAAAWVSSGKYPVDLSYKWFESGRMLGAEGQRTLLIAPLRPGRVAYLNARVVVPNAGTNLTVKFSLVQEGVAWFFIRGAPTLDIPVRLK